ncbi:MAG: sugar phosphate isomerase/epimerase [Spirochaetales bacterium]|nr:sugar phosphate isomerase/epimerase [Spirochaetales bacterium]
MIKTGLVSITFRNLTVEEILETSVKAGIEGIEWGGDIHVPHGDIQEAESVGKKTRDTGLEVAAYGSYYRFDDDDFTFEEVLHTAIALKAPLIRVWAGRLRSGECSPEYYNRMVRDIRKAGNMCKDAGIKLAFEYHDGTLTDTNASSLKLMKDIDCPSVFSYWQPPVGMTREKCLEGIDLIKDYLQHIHVFYWDSGSRDRKKLSEGENLWKEYFKIISTIDGERWALLEFVKDDSVENFYDDAQTLKRIISV